VSSTRPSEWRKQARRPPQGATRSTQSTEGRRAKSQRLRRKSSASSNARGREKRAEKVLARQERMKLTPFCPNPFRLRSPPRRRGRWKANLRGLAVGLRRRGESEEEAYERVRSREHYRYTRSVLALSSRRAQVGRISCRSTRTPSLGALEPLLKSGSARHRERRGGNLPGRSRGPVSL